MSSGSVDYQLAVGRAFAIVALVLSPLSTYFRRTYSISLDLVQMSYIFSIVFAPNISTFSDHLGDSWLVFMPSFLTFCKT